MQITRLAFVRPRRSFTLVELLAVIAIIAILSSIAMFGMFEAQQEARRQRTRSQITKINELLMNRWEAYRTRAIPVPVPAGMNPTTAADYVLRAKRQLMRMEFPDRQTDLADGPQQIHPLISQLPQSSLWRSYRRRLGFYPPPPPAVVYGPSTPPAAPAIPPGWTGAYQGAECLYVILASIRDELTSGLDFFQANEIGDKDGDGAKEIWDAWGNPIEFIRWAPAFSPSLLQDSAQPDPLDPLKIDPRWNDATAGNEPFSLFPLVISAGPDGVLDVLTQFAEDRAEQSPNYAPYSSYPDVSAFRNDPYRMGSTGLILGQITGVRATDNISNHFLEVK